ncbi:MULTISPECIES: hypothetical protein [unclassified Microbacterium]|uniref:hypothetical protein n=1 Tax=unclassified Microbacterium TaxID=2609290 RepID=UPI000CFB59BF|nr:MULTISPECIES: hypothetical protein [unclassified Microbacterium]PQZ53034.1 hypothetical protein CQ032_16300 [Microbacterium sp. MYb43]PQZ73262.1 hypothetical protein CQ031_17655 [Microbacterium sp. MYb40]PRB18718.1 hypothetical protein CQ040_16720 [Microbacterium sp. MYb54]PRB24389.1 hypothetical protein CQ037_17075 [Microbacterium sp. MYb50]PRB64437.1 hypothetical protein CQ027_20025 [Microbacterium sp. MYb32]
MTVETGPECTLVTITGGAGAGKTTIAAALSVALNAPVVYLDDYYLTDLEKAPTYHDENGVERVDVGDPRAIDWESATIAVSSAMAERSLVVVDGLFAASISLNLSASIQRLDVYIDLEDDLRLVRRIQSKVIDGDLPIEALLWNYVNLRRQAFIVHTLPWRDRSHIVLPGDAETSNNVATIVTTLGRRMDRLS